MICYRYDDDDYDSGAEESYECLDEEYSEGLCKFHHKGMLLMRRTKKI